MSLEAALKDWQARAARATRAAHLALGNHESATSSRVVVLEQLLTNLSGTPVDIQDYFRESAKCLDVGANRAAIVLAWAGFMHTLAEKLVREHESTLRAARPKWAFKDLDDLKEKQPEAQILDAAKEVGLIKKGQLRIYQGQLALRNQCAHPTLYSPTSNAAIGFVDSMLLQTVAITPP